MTGNARTGWDADAVLTAANEWSWVPPGAPHVRTDEYLVVAYPEHLLTPTGARVFGSERAPADLVDEVHEVARRLGRHRLWWHVSDASRPAGLEAELRGRGAVVVERRDVLALPLDDDLPAIGVPAGIELKRVRDLQSMRDAHVVERSAFGGVEHTEDQLRRALADLAPGLEDDATGVVVAYVDGQPAGVGGWTVVDEVCRLWGGGTHESLRGRGAYRAVLAARLRIARAAGATLGLTHGRVDTSSPILRRIGFMRYGEQRQLVLDV
ncbi:GNAT family N-acetyltransferase [Intrasporangium sp.]|uniref:GNAT family N-acetyltransferase n=1 Tax=Intrasporangium sp. TaxID=1925024 RepID=UPI00293A2D24|nr:GNAT family N-acetyltransferase [Intrasporangium sp.]MDV3222504.1 GNAT family N-acetyltransferase [Intrasporangium sp.]